MAMAKYVMPFTIAVTIFLPWPTVLWPFSVNIQLAVYSANFPCVYVYCSVNNLLVTDLLLVTELMKSIHLQDKNFVSKLKYHITMLCMNRLKWLYTKDRMLLVE